MAKDINSIFFDITSEIEELALKCEKNNAIEKELYTKYEVKRGLRDLNGKGVLAGLTNISDVCVSLMQSTRDMKRPHIYFCSENFRIKKSWLTFRR